MSLCNLAPHAAPAEATFLSIFLYSGTEKSPSIFTGDVTMNKIIFQISLQQGMLWDRVLIPGIWAWVLQLTSVTVTKSWPKQFMKEDTDSFGSQSCRTTSSTSTRLYNPFVSEPSEGCTLRSGVYGGVNIPITNQEQCVTVWERRRKGEREWKIQRHRNRQSWAFPVSARHTQNNRRASY